MHDGLPFALKSCNPLEAWDGPKRAHYLRKTYFAEPSAADSLAEAKRGDSGPRGFRWAALATAAGRAFITPHWVIIPAKPQ
jgi:hypothetical protein